MSNRKVYKDSPLAVVSGSLAKAIAAADQDSPQSDGIAGPAAQSFAAQRSGNVKTFLDRRRQEKSGE